MKKMISISGMSGAHCAAPVAKALKAAAVCAALALAACAETDVVAKAAAASFDAVVQKLGDKVGYSPADKAWRIASPADDRLLVALDFDRPDANGQSPDFTVDLDAAPFLAAGLDPAKLPDAAADGRIYRLENGRLLLRFDWGAAALPPAADGSAAPAEPTAPAAGLGATFKRIVAGYRQRLGYHEKLDHFGFALGDGNMVEWAKDMNANDKDLVFALNPGPLANAGLDPKRLAGWTLAAVETKDADGKKIVVDKLLRPFDL